MGLHTYGVSEEARMHLHRNAALGIAGRRRLVGLIESGLSQRQAAAALGVSPATANRWARRWRAAAEPERVSSACLVDRSSRPHRSPRKLSADQEAPILAARAATNLGPGRLAHICRRARSTIWKVLHRHGLSRRRQARARSGAATSGPGRGRSSTSTPPVWRALSAPAIAPAARWRSATPTSGLATSICTWLSMT